MPSIYIISGCNGAGKSTIAEILLPKFLNCKEFVNADSIAKGLSPFQPETVAIQSGRIMLSRIKQLIKKMETFAFETTLTAKSYVNLIKSAKDIDYKIVLYYFWIDSAELALKRIADRVKKGGHDIPKDVVERRYYRSLDNLVNLFIPISNEWYIYDNSLEMFNPVAEGNLNELNKVYNNNIWNLVYEHKN